MDIKNSFDITVSESLIQRLEKVKKTATQNTENAIGQFNHTIEQAKGSVQENLPHVSVQTVVTSSITDWFEEHPAFLRIINSLNWAANHPIISLIIIVFSLAILWNLVKLIGSLIEKASLSILEIPFKLLGALIKSFWLCLVKVSHFATDKFKQTKTVNSNSELQLNDNNPYQIISYNRQQRLKDISARLAELQLEQQELLKEAAEIVDAEKFKNSVN